MILFIMKFSSLLFFFLFVMINSNPYIILGVAPYYSLKEIKEKYMELLTKNHPNNYSLDKEELKLNFEKIQKAYEEIKESRIDEDEENNNYTQGYLFAIKKCLWSILFGSVIILISYLIIYLSLEILSFTFRFLVILIFIFFPTEYFLAHIFENEESQYFTCILLSLFVIIILYLRTKYLNKISPDNHIKTN